MGKYLAALLIFMSGCGGNSNDGPSASLDNHGYGFAFDAMGNQGLKLRRPSATNLDADFLESRAKADGICTGIEAPPPPFVIVVPIGSLGQDVGGLYFSNSPLILVTADEIDSTGFDHEVIHYLLDFKTGDSDKQHTSPAWNCVLTF